MCVGTIRRTVWSSTLTRLTSSACGRKRCYRPQRTNAKRRDAKRLICLSVCLTVSVLASVCLPVLLPVCLSVCLGEPTPSFSLCGPKPVLFPPQCRCIYCFLPGAEKCGGVFRTGGEKGEVTFLNIHCSIIHRFIHLCELQNIFSSSSEDSESS